MSDGFIEVRDLTTKKEALAFGMVQGTPYWAAMSSPMQPLSFFCPEHKRLFDYRTSCPECEKGGEE